MKDKSRFVEYNLNIFEKNYGPHEISDVRLFFQDTKHTKQILSYFTMYDVHPVTHCTVNTLENALSIVCLVLMIYGNPITALGQIQRHL